MNAARFASRKFLLAVAVVLAACGLLLAGKVDADQFASLIKWALAWYVVGNVGARAAGKPSA